jgi:AraC family transcriptional regulator
MSDGLDRRAPQVSEFEPQIPRGKPGLDPRKLETALRFIESSFHTNISIARIAAAAFVSPFHFSRGFTKAVGKSPWAYVTARRMEMAKELLARPEMPIALIARQVGYRTTSHFTGVFTRVVGTSPGRYRHALAAGPTASNREATQRNEGPSPAIGAAAE